MNKDLFEIQIGEQLRNAEAAVPEGAWEAIQSAISTPTPPAANDGGSSASGFGAGFGVGAAAGVIMLGSLATHSALKSDSNSSEANYTKTASVEVVEAQTDKLDNPETSPQTARFEDFEPTDLTEKVQVAESVADEADDVTAEQTVAEQGDMAHTEMDASADQSNAVEAASETRDSKADTSPAVTAANEPAPSNTSTEKESAAENAANDPAPETDVASFATKAQIEANVTTGFAPLSVQLRNAGKAAEYFWDMGQKGTAQTAQTEVEFDEPGTYRISLTAYGDDGEAQYDEIEIAVEEGSEILLPNIFTPNGDGLNDSYKVGYAKNIEDFYLLVTDENGKTVFETRDIDFEWGTNVIDFGSPNTRYYVTYMAMGVDGAKHAKSQMPLIIVRD